MNKKGVLMLRACVVVEVTVRIGAAHSAEFV